MFARIVKFLCIGTLAMAALRIEGGPRILVELVLCGGAAFVMIQAAQNRKYIWMVPFGLIAIYFNPILPTQFSRVAELPILLACLILFAISLRYLPTMPRMSLATITDLPARGESL